MNIVMLRPKSLPSRGSERSAQDDFVVDKYIVWPNLDINQGRWHKCEYVPNAALVSTDRQIKHDREICRKTFDTFEKSFAYIRSLMDATYPIKTMDVSDGTSISFADFPCIKWSHQKNDMALYLTPRTYFINDESVIFSFDCEISEKIYNYGNTFHELDNIFSVTPKTFRG